MTSLTKLRELDQEAQQRSLGPWEEWEFGIFGGDTTRNDMEFVVAVRNSLSALLDIAEAAQALHAGLTCPTDPMDVDERIERLSAALAALTDPKEELGGDPRSPGVEQQ